MTRDRTCNWLGEGMRFAGWGLVCVALLSACGKGDEQSAAPGAALQIPMVLVPAGEFIRGSDAIDNEGLQQRYGFAAPLFLDEHPQHKMTLPNFYIDTYEVTNSQYRAFTESTQRKPLQAWIENGYAYTPTHLQGKSVEELRTLATDLFKLDMDTRGMSKDALIDAMLKQQKEKDALPAGGMSWMEAYAFCVWRGVRLPSEAEWEKAARGVNGAEFPWGAEWNPKIVGTGEDGRYEEGIAPVGSYPDSRAPYGAQDMAGNAWEWVQDWYDAYPGSDYTTKEFGKKNRVIRGGSGGVGHYGISYFYRGATRQWAPPEMESDDVGLRCARNTDSS